MTKRLGNALDCIMTSLAYIKAAKEPLCCIDFPCEVVIKYAAAFMFVVYCNTFTLRKAIVQMKGIGGL